MRYLSVCSGIEAATVAWKPLGFHAAGFAEIEKFPSAVLKHHYPEVKNFGDFTKIEANDVGPIDLLVGGTPCQSFSVAGLRGGMDDDRGKLALEFLRLAARTRPRWVVWENVPGVLSSNGGRDFGSFLGGLVELGYGFAYRVLDAQYFGVPQRRRRVFVVGHLGDWRRAAAVLFERHSLSGYPPPRREAGKGITYDVAPCLGASGRGFERTGDTRGQDCCVPIGLDEEQNAVVDGFGTLKSRERGGGFEGTVAIPSTGDISHWQAFGGNRYSGPIDIATACQAHGGPHGRLSFENETFIAFSAKDHGADAMEDCSATLRAGGHSGSHANAGVMPAVAIRTANTSANGHGIAEDVAHTLDQAQGQAVACFKGGQGAKAGGLGYSEHLSPTLSSAPSGTQLSPTLLHHMAVRRLTVIECSRLQGFSDTYVLIPTRTWRKLPADEAEYLIRHGLGKFVKQEGSQWMTRIAADGPAYKALGNSMCTKVMSYIGQRILSVQESER